MKTLRGGSKVPHKAMLVVIRTILQVTEGEVYDSLKVVSYWER